MLGERNDMTTSFCFLGLSDNISIWIAALLTLIIFSFLYKDNPLFKLVEHLFAGVASAYFFCTQWFQALKPNLIDPALDADTPTGERCLLLVPLFLCLCMLTKVVPKWGWMSRWALAFIIGFYAGTNMPQFLDTAVVQQIESTCNRSFIAEGDDTAERIGHSLDNMLFVLGVVSVLTFFYFSLPHTGKIGTTLKGFSTMGRYFMMVAFGATFANAVMGRVSVLIGSLNLLLKDWLGISG
jgi:hypothetical protein